MPGQLFVFSSPSGAGKSTIVNALRNRIDGLGYSISHTTRKPRGAEEDGIDYHFVDRKKFNIMIEEGTFVEWAKVYDDFYGTCFLNLSKQLETDIDILLDLDTQGARNIKTHFKKSVLIYVLPPSMEILEKRLKERGTDDEGVIETRMKKASDEIKNCLWYDYIILNEDLKRAIGEAQAIIMSERCRSIRQAPNVKRLFAFDS